MVTEHFFRAWFGVKLKSNVELLVFLITLRHFSLERRKTKLNTLPNQSQQTQTINQSKREAIICNKRQAWQNACEQITVGFSFTPDWLRKWRVF